MERGLLDSICDTVDIPIQSSIVHAQRVCGYDRGSEKFRVDKMW
jgi:hypothetical protein